MLMAEICAAEGSGSCRCLENKEGRGRAHASTSALLSLQKATFPIARHGGNPSAHR